MTKPLSDAGAADLTGMRIGHLTVTGCTPRGTGMICDCVCDCGRRIRRNASRLRYAQANHRVACCSYSCPCKPRPQAQIVHSGMLIGHLTVLSPIRDGSGRGRWECVCDCGRHVIRENNSLANAVRTDADSDCGKGCALRTGRQPRRRYAQRVQVDLDEFADYIAACRAGVARQARGSSA